jgi:hypothetical protein
MARLIRRWNKGTDPNWPLIRAKQLDEEAQEALNAAVLDANSTCMT